jgi:hypothetical protein
MQSTSGTAAPEVLSIRGSTPNRLQDEVDSLKQEVATLGAKLESVVKELEDLKQIKVETVSRVSLVRFRSPRALAIFPEPSPITVSTFRRITTV